MRVLHLLTSVTGAGCGIVNAAVDIISGQQKQNLDIAVCAGEGEIREMLDHEGIKFYPLNQKRKPKSLWLALRELHGIITTFKPDVIHCHMMTSVVLARTLRIVTPFAIVAHVHNVHQRSSDLMRLADRVIAVSEAVRVDMVRRGIPARKIRVIHNGSLGSLRLKALTEEPSAKLCQPAIVTVGGMNLRKGISELITAFEHLSIHMPGHHLYLVGDGPDAKRFKSQASQSEFCDQIHFVGFKANPLPYMKAARLFVLASKRESFGLVLTEARQCGCAILATDVDGIPEALDGGKAGLLVPSNDPAVLLKGMLSLLGNDELLLSFQQKAKEGLQRFTVDRLSADVSKVYADVIAI